MSPGSVKFEPVRFSTADLPARDRVAIFREEFGQQIVRVDIEPLPDKPLQAEATMRWLPGLRMAILNTTPGLRLARTPELIAADNDDVFCFLMEFGEATMASLRGHNATLERGDAVLLYSMEPCATAHVESQLVSATVPRTALAPLIRNAEDATLQVIPAGTEALRLLPIYLRAAREELPLASPELRHLVETHVYDLIALAVGVTGDGATLAESRGLRAARLAAVKADILANLTQRDLTVANVAMRQGVTPRYVHMLFEAEGTTFSAFVLEQRLARARQMLADPRYESWPVSSIALECGFGDISYFNRCFRRRYGATPSDLRNVNDAPD